MSGPLPSSVLDVDAQLSPQSTGTVARLSLVDGPTHTERNNGVDPIRPLTVPPIVPVGQAVSNVNTLSLDIPQSPAIISPSSVVIQSLSPEQQQQSTPWRLQPAAQTPGVVVASTTTTTITAPIATRSTTTSTTTTTPLPTRSTTTVLLRGTTPPLAPGQIPVDTNVRSTQDTATSDRPPSATATTNAIRTELPIRIASSSQFRKEVNQVAENSIHLARTPPAVAPPTTTRAVQFDTARAITLEPISSNQVRPGDTAALLASRQAVIGNDALPSALGANVTIPATCSADLARPCSLGFGRGCSMTANAQGCPVCSCPYSRLSSSVDADCLQNHLLVAVLVRRAWGTRTAHKCYWARSRVPTANACRLCIDGTDG